MWELSKGGTDLETPHTGSFCWNRNQEVAGQVKGGELLQFPDAVWQGGEAVSRQAELSHVLKAVKDVAQPADAGVTYLRRIKQGFARGGGGSGQEYNFNETKYERRLQHGFRRGWSPFRTEGSGTGGPQKTPSSPPAVVSLFAGAGERELHRANQHYTACGSDLGMYQLWGSACSVCLS